MDSNWSRRALLAGLGTAGFVGLSGCNTLQSREAPSVTVHNKDDTQYRLAVHIVPDVTTRNEIPFRATDAGGERRYTSPDDLRSGATYRNVTVSHEDSARSTHTVDPAVTTSVTVDGWNRGDAIAALIETTDGSTSLIALKVMTCESSGQTVSITVNAGEQAKTSSNCP